MTEQTNEALKDYLGMIAKALETRYRGYRFRSRLEARLRSLSPI